MKVSIRFLINHRKYIPTKTILQVILMAGLNAISSKMKYLSSIGIAKIKGQQVSVVRYGDRDNIVLPDNCNESGILLVPKVKTVDEWQAQHSNRF